MRAYGLTARGGLHTASLTIWPLDVGPTEHRQDLEVVNADGQERDVNGALVQDVPRYSRDDDDDEEPDD